MPSLNDLVPRPRLDAGRAGDPTPDLPAVLEDVRAAAEQLRTGRAVLDAAVVRARLNGATWDDLTGPLAVTKQAARRRYVRSGGAPGPRRPATGALDRQPR